MLEDTRIGLSFLLSVGRARRRRQRRWRTRSCRSARAICGEDFMTTGRTLATHRARPTSTGALCKSCCAEGLA